MTLVTLPHVTDAATMQRISFWRYSAVKRKTLFTALACALLVFSMLGCGTTNHLQSITLSAALINGIAPTGQSGFYSLQGNGGTIQLKATGNYSDGKTKDLTSVVTFAMVVDPVNNVDAFGFALPAPPQTAQISVTGLVTAVEPADCTWIDVSPDPTKQAWLYVGAYQVNASFQGITSQPVYIPVASSGGNTDDIFANPPLVGNNPTELCGPTS
jgi:hypothetical protein